MGLRDSLVSFEELLGSRFPDHLDAIQRGCDDAAIDRLRAVLAPHRMPAQVETLYRWRNGGPAGVFGGWSLRPVDELLDWRQFCLTDLGEPPAWLQLFDDQMLGFVTLDVDDRRPAGESVWYGHTHDTHVSALFDSIEALVDVCAAALQDGHLLPAGPLDLRLGGDVTSSLDGREWDDRRLARCPGAYRWPDPPAGTHLPRSPDPTWPVDWLASLGLDLAASRPRGATTTVAALVAAASAAPAEGTIRGVVLTGAGVGDHWLPEVDDGTGRLRVLCDQRQVHYLSPVGTTAEFDVTLDAATPPPGGDLPLARARAVRPVPAP